MRPIALAALLAAVACGGPETTKPDDDTLADAGDADTDADSDADTDADTDTDTDTDADTDTTAGDADGDGVSDSTEGVLGTDPHDPDSDDDGLTDGEELFDQQTNPLDDDSDDDGLTDGDEVNTWGSDPNAADTDGDSLTDGDEVTAGTDPTLHDTDGDGLDDDQEPLYHTDPTDADSDDDGLLDGEELGTGCTPTDQDSDDDGLLDGEEVHVYGSNPLATDSDGDGLPDGVEVHALGTDPTLTDTDGDGLDDPDEVRDHTDPTLADTDGDGLEDGDEPTFSCDPNDPDTDGDGLEDGAEIALSSNPLVQDTDGDGLLDGEEVNTWGSSPILRDTDGDLLDDRQETLLHLDPADPDTDGGGTFDGQELIDGTDPHDPADDTGGGVCLYPDVPIVDRAYVPPLPTFDPIWASVDWGLAADASGAHDYADGGVDTSSWLKVTLYGPERDRICQVTFDLSGATRVPPTSFTATSGQLHDAWQVDVADGTTDCPALDPGVYGSSDIRTVLSRVPWGLGIGTLGDLAGDLQAEVLAQGGDWTNDWAPYVDGGFVSFDRLVAEPLDYAFVDQTTCADLDTDGSGDPIPLPATAPGSVPDGFQAATRHDWFGSDRLMPECRRPSYAMASGWVGGQPTIQPDHYFFFANFTPTPDGTLTDMAWDYNLNGIPDVFTAYVTIGIYDANNNYLCQIDYDVSDATPVDPATLTSTSGALYQAWTAPLTNGNSNCNDVPVLQFATRDLRNYFANQGFVFGIGELQAILPFMAAPGVGTHALYAGWGYPAFTDVYEMDVVNAYDMDGCYVRDPANRIQPLSVTTDGGIANQDAEYAYFAFSF